MMIRTSILLVICLFSVLPSVAHSQQTGPTNSEFTSGKQIDRILAEIQSALLTAQNQASISKLPQLASVSLELKTELAYDAKGELNLYVVTVGGNVEKEDEQRLVITLTPPKPGTEQPIGAGDVTESLSTAILAAARGVAAAQKRKPPLNVSKFEVEIRFVVSAAGSTGVKFELLPITASINGEIKSKSVQIAHVTFEALGK